MGLVWGLFRLVLGCIYIMHLGVYLGLRSKKQKTAEKQNSGEAEKQRSRKAKKQRRRERTKSRKAKSKEAKKLSRETEIQKNAQNIQKKQQPKNRPPFVKSQLFHGRGHTPYAPGGTLL